LTRERLDLGKLGEDLALRKIRRMGYRCIARNYRCPLGEVDIVAEEDDTLVFIEIKTRRGSSLGYAKEAVNARKQRQLSKVALFYCQENGCADRRSRFDVVAVNLEGDRARIQVIKDAFELSY